MSLVRRVRLAAPLLLASLAFASGVHAQAAPSKGDQALKYRKALYQVMAYNFGPMSAMAQGKAPYDAADFATRAARVATVAAMLGEAFPPESKGVAGSKLKPAMWENRADFDAKLRDLVERSAVLARVAPEGSFEKSKAELFDTANACKACHEKYRAD